MLIFSNTYSLRIVGRSIYDEVNVYDDCVFGDRTKMDIFGATGIFSMHCAHFVMLA